MTGRRRRFTRDEIRELRRLLRQKETADRDTQKRLRAKMRRIGFSIEDFSDDPRGFTASDLDELIMRGVVIVDEAAGADP